MTTTSRRFRRWRSARAVVGGVAAVGLVAAMLTTALAGAQAAPTAAPVDSTAKIKPKLAKQLDAKGEATFWVRFEARADLSDARKIEDWNARGQAVYDALTSTAEASQRDIRAQLEADGVDFKAFWATNAIRVNAGSQELAENLAAQPEVEALYPSFKVELEKPIKGKDVREINAVEWGIANINADDVWSQFGVTGEGITVANIDTGVQFDHPALVGKYRGNNGDGTFDHNYNWFNASGGSCTEAPCDNNGHGTHTMGTMAGDDGAGNQIGVAPGVKWIAANGCCPSDQALIDSGEWMLAPRDLSDDPSTADPSKRPNIINNSWGTQLPSNNPFMEDISEDWAAAGIFGTWSNGNIGPGCQTSGSPGSRIINYSVGAYDINNNIAGFSSRGAGQDGEIKPNISAPGVNVRSSVPGSGYASFNGTSMAAPHLAGSIALLWSAAPTLLGDVEATRALLNDTAVDHEDGQCGGTADDNNVYGEGQLDALALLNSAPIGDTGTLEGTVTDAATGDPIDDATITIEGPSSRSLSTEADGTYSALLAAGDYTVTASKFGYGEQTASVTITADQTTTQDFALEGSPSVTMDGVVTDGSGKNWPLYAEISVDGADQTWFTDPATGFFEVTLPANATYTITIESQYPGYLPLTQEVTVGGSDFTQDFALLVDDSQCIAPGYQFNVDGVTENFNSGTLPAGWEVVDNIGNGQVWRFDNPAGRDNLTGGDGSFAIMDSDFYGPAGTQDTSLVSPVTDMSALTSPVVGFKQDYNNLGDFADVDVSIDGGATWETVLHQTTSVRGPREDVIQLPQAAGQSQVQVRFHNYEADFDWWWEVDDVFLGNRTCDPIRGGLVVGNVYDANTDEGINGATVTNLDQPTDSVKTMATPDDTGLDDGFYWMFTSLTGSHPFEASAGNYSTETETVQVRNNDASSADFVLDAGLLSVEPTEVSATMRLGDRTRTRTFEVTNNGGLPVEVEFGERKGGFVMLGADGSRMSRQAILNSDGAKVRHVRGNFSPLSQVDAGKAGKATTARPTPNEAPWTNIADYPEPTMDAGAALVDGKLYSFGGVPGPGVITNHAFVYDPASLSWSAISPVPVDGLENPAVETIDGLIYITGGWNSDGSNNTTTWAYDPGADSYTEVADQPVGLAASGRAVLDGALYTIGGCQDACGFTDVQRYDPGADTWTAVADYPEPISHVGCGAISGALYCAGGTGGSSTTANGYVYDAGADSWTPIADIPIDLWGMGYTAANDTLLLSGGITQGFAVITNEGFSYDPSSDSWTELPASNSTVYRGGSACGFYKLGGSIGGFSPIPQVEQLPGFEECGAATDVPWLSIDTTSATLAPGESVTVRVTMSANVAQPGTYTAGVGIKENTPYSVSPVGVTMHITPPVTWGKLAGTVTGVSCQGESSPLAGATVQVDSWATDWTFETDAQGQYAYWIDVRNNPLSIIAAKDGYKPKFRTVRIRQGQTVTANFALQKAGC